MPNDQKRLFQALNLNQAVIELCDPCIVALITLVNQYFYISQRLKLMRAFQPSRDIV